MKNIKNSNLIIANMLFLMFPLSLILGNFFTNVNIILISIFTFIFYYKKKVKFEINFFDKIVLIFFFYTLVSLIVNFFESYLNNEIFSKYIIDKTFFYFRYLFLYLALRILMNQKILRLDWFSITCSVCATFVCLDVFFQFFFGKDIFGIVSTSARHYSGVFGAELIAGGYMQKFALFSFFLPFTQRKRFFFKIPILFTFFIFFAVGITISGNRMPLVLFILSFLIFLLLDKKKRKYLFVTLVAVFLLLVLAYKSSETSKYHVSNFYYHGKNVITSLSIKDLTQESMTTANKPYVLEFHCFKVIWKYNPIFGGGVKSYRIQDGGCNNHPHNYYFEILTDLGLVGLSIILFLIFMLLRKILLNESASFQLNRNTLDSKVMPFFLIFFFEFFPFRTTGSFFTTSNASIIFIVLAILVSLVSKKKSFAD